MTIDNKTKLLISLPVVLIVILAVSADYIPLIQELSVVEQQILEFSPDKLKINEKPQIHISRNLHNPMDFRSVPAEQQAKLGDDLVQRFDYNDKSLSLVVISDRNKMAVINGRLLKEGETVDGTKIAKIEPGRVLLKNKTTQWLYVEEVK